MSLCRLFFFFYLFQGNTKPPAYAVEIEVLHGNSDFSPAQYKQMLKEYPRQHFPQCICGLEQISPCLSCMALLPK